MWSDTVREFAANPRNPGPLENYTHKGTSGEPGEGPYMVIWLIIESGTIVHAAFHSNGCPSALACGGMTTVLIAGKQIGVAARLEPEDLIRVLGGLPEGKDEYAAMAVGALRRALQLGE